MSKPKLIIVEGADCTGKTSLAKFIAKRLGAAYMHATGHKTLHGGMVAYHKNILENARACMEVSGISVVLDRHWPSEMCYGVNLRYEQHVKTGYFSGEFFGDIQSLGGRYVFCFSDKACDRQITSPDQTHPYSREEYDKVYRDYEKVFTSLVREKENITTYSIEQHGHDMNAWFDNNIF